MLPSSPAEKNSILPLSIGCPLSAGRCARTIEYVANLPPAR